MANLFTRMFESNEEKGARMARETEALRKKRKKKKKAADYSQMKVAPVTKQPGLGNTMDAIRRRKKMLGSL